MICLGRQRCVQRNYFTLSRQCLRICVFDTKFARPVIRWIDIEREHFHSESAQNLCGDAANFSGAKNTGGLAVEIKADESIEGKIQVVYTIIRARNLTIECEQQCDGMLSHGVGRISRHACYQNTEFLRGGEVNAIESSAAKGDMFDADLLQLFQARTISSVVHENAHRLRALRKWRGRRRKTFLQKSPVDRLRQAGPS